MTSQVSRSRKRDPGEPANAAMGKGDPLTRRRIPRCRNCWASSHSHCVGRVDLDDGKVWRDVAAGPDSHLGRVHEAGRMGHHAAGQADEHIGRIGGDAILAQAGAAFLLLVWPAFVEQQHRQRKA